MHIFQKALFTISVLLFINTGCVGQFISDTNTPTSVPTGHTVLPTDNFKSTAFLTTLTPHSQRTATKTPLNNPTIETPDLSKLIIDDLQLLEILEEADATLDQNGLIIISPQDQLNEFRVAAIVQKTPASSNPAHLIIELIYHSTIKEAKQNSAKYRAEKLVEGFKETDTASSKNYPNDTWIFVKDKRFVEINTIYHQYEIRIRMQSTLIGKEDTASFTDLDYFVNLLLEIDKEEVKKLEKHYKPKND